MTRQSGSSTSTYSATALIPIKCWNGCTPVYDASAPDSSHMAYQHDHRLFIDVVGVRLLIPLSHIAVVVILSQTWLAIRKTAVI